ncbi:MAG: hypothetical protein AB1567_04320 [bacterium]
MDALQTEGNQEEAVLANFPEPNVSVEDQSESQQVETPEGKSYYTSEEMSNLDLAEVDTSRIPPEHLPFYKAMQSGWNKKYMSLAEERKAFEKEREAFKSQQVQFQPKSLEEAYFQNPAEVLAYLDNQIEAKQQEGEIDEVNKLMNVKLNLIAKRQEYTENMVRQREEEEKILADIKTQIPDFEIKASKIGEFAKKELGLTEDDILTLTNPRLGKTAVRVITAISKIYDLHNADKNLQKKEGILSNPNIQPAGIVSGQSKNLTSLLEKAKQSGLEEDWAAYILAKGGR